MKVEWTEGAIKDLEKLDHQVVRRILRRVAWLSRNFERGVPGPLDGEFKGTYKLRVGDWRVVCTAQSETIIIQFIGHRREIYKIITKSIILFAPDRVLPNIEIPKQARNDCLCHAELVSASLGCDVNNLMLCLVIDKEG